MTAVNTTVVHRRRRRRAVQRPLVLSLADFGNCSNPENGLKAPYIIVTSLPTNGTFRPSTDGDHQRDDGEHVRPAQYLRAA